MVLFWFIMFSYNSRTFRGSYFFEGLIETDSLFNFLKTHIAYGFSMNPFWDENEALPVSGMFFITGYFIIINLIMTTIFTGIIIDSFSELRAISKNIKEDNVVRCFICNIDRDDFERLELNYDKHTMADHNMWNYLFFRIYLENLDPIEMTGLEFYVYQCLSQNSIAYFPIKKSIRVKGRNKENKDLFSLHDKLEKLDIIIKKTEEKLEEEKEHNANEFRRVNLTLEKVVDKLDTLTSKVNALRK